MSITKYSKIIVKDEFKTLSKNVKFYKYKDTRNPMYFISKSKLERFRNRINNLSSVKIVEDSYIESSHLGICGPKESDFNMVESRYIANKIQRLEYEIESSIKELEFESNKNTRKYLNGYIQRKNQELIDFKRVKGIDSTLNSFL